MTDQQLRDQHRCYICLQEIRAGKATWHAGLNVFLCLDTCAKRAADASRVYDHSRKGRWRPNGEWKRMLRAMRPTEMTDA